MIKKIKPAHTDVDIDFADRTKALDGLTYIIASRKQGSEMLQHNTGVYFQNIPIDPLTNRSNIDSKDAENRGYFKLDFLNVSLYNDINSEQHLDQLLNTTPKWELLEYEEFVSELWHIGNHTDLVTKMKPTSVDELAMVMAIIRPAKSHLQYKPWHIIEQSVWIPPSVGDKGYNFKNSFFKKSHSYAYSLGIVVQMNLIVEQLMDSADE